MLLEPAIIPPAALGSFIEAAEPVLAAHRAGDAAKALDLWMNAVSAASWRSALSNAVPGAEQQAGRDAAAFFDVEFPAFREFVFDAERASRISQPVLYLLGGESGPLFEAAQRHFESLVPHAEFARVPGVDHLMQMGDPKRVAAPIADFLARHPL